MGKDNRCLYHCVDLKGFNTHPYLPQISKLCITYAEINLNEFMQATAVDISIKS